MYKAIRIAALVLGLVALGPTGSREARAAKQILRFQAVWSVNPNGDCGQPNSALSLASSQADIDIVFFSYFFISDPCSPTPVVIFVQGVGPVSISGNQTRLFVDGTIQTPDGRPVNIDLTLQKTGNLADPGPGEKLVSASATGEVVLDGQDLTGGAPSTTAQISKSKN